MSVLVRKINRAKWSPSDTMCDDDVPADAITSCMRTNSNSLSVWEVESDDNLDDSVLAVAAASDRLETIDVVPLSAEYLRDNGIVCRPSRGRTPVENLAKTHRDLVNLSYRTLGVIAYHIVDRISDNRVRRYTVASQKQILKAAITAGTLRREDLTDSVNKTI